MILNKILLRLSLDWITSYTLIRLIKIKIWINFVGCTTSWSLVCGVSACATALTGERLKESARHKFEGVQH
jgi:hypothetical protein